MSDKNYFETTEVSMPKLVTQMPENIKNKYQYFTEADITKLRKAGYEGKITSLEDAIKDYVHNYLQKDEYLEAR